MQARVGEMNIPAGKRMGLKGTGDGKTLVQRKRSRKSHWKIKKKGGMLG